MSRRLTNRAESLSLKAARASRVPQACTQCKAKKIKCDGLVPVCSPCTLKGLDCLYSPVQKKRGPGKSKQRIKALEDRLAKMETTLQDRNDLMRDSTEQHRNHSFSPVQIESQEPTSTGNALRESCSLAATTSVAPVPPKLPGLEERFMAISIFDRLRERVNDYMSGGPVQLHDTDKLLLRNTIGESFNEFPIFHASWLLEQLKNELPTRENNLTWWCCVCATVTLAIPVKALNSDFRKVIAFALTVFRAAYSELPNLVAQGHDIQAVQAVLAMAMFSRLLADTKTASILSSTAARMLQPYCLPGTGTDDGRHSQADRESQIRTCFWAAYIMDTDISINSGLSPSYSTPDIDMELPDPQYLKPSELSQAGLPAHHGTVFRLRAELATIQSRIRRDLYSASVLKVPSDELLTVLLRLTAAVEAWKSRVPPEIMPDDSADANFDSAVLSLHFAYYNCISATYWAVRRYGIWKLRLNDSTLGCQDEISGGKVRAAARATLHLIERIRAPQFTTLWGFLHYAVAAFLVILEFILRKPTEPSAKLDYAIMCSFVQFLHKMITEEHCDLVRMHKGCAELARIAGALLEEIDMRQRTGEGHRTNGVAQEIVALFWKSTCPMFVAQGLMGNLPNRDAYIAHALSDIVGLSREKGSRHGCFVPESLMLETYTQEADTGDTTV